MPLNKLEQLAYNALIAQKEAVAELFKELGNKEAGNWGIINGGLVQADETIKVLEKSWNENEVDCQIVRE